MARRLSTATELFGKSYNIVKANLGIFALLYSASAVIAIVASVERTRNVNSADASWGGILGNNIFGGSFHTSLPATTGLLFTALTVVSIVFGLLTTILCLRAAQSHKPSFDTIWAEFTRRWMWLRLLFLLIAMAIAIGIGFVLLVIPGVILVWRLMFAPYILIDQKVEISEAFVRSWEMTKGHAWAIYSIILLSILLGVTSFIPIIGSFVAFLLGVAYSVAPALRYQEIKHLRR
jgi:hypothetical protein